MSSGTRIRQQANSLPEDSKRAVRQAAASPLMETLMRLGYVVRGLIYGVIGLLAFQVVLGGRRTFDDPQGAIVTISQTSFGGVLVYAILIGLIGYSLWGFIRAVFDPLHKGTDMKGIVERLAFAISGISYGLLAVATYGLITGRASAAQNGAQAAQTQQAAASIMSNSWGPIVVGIAGIAVMGSGLIQIIQGIRRDLFEKQLQPFTLNMQQRERMIQLGRFGTAARGVVFTLVGAFLFLAAYRHDPRQAQGIDGALAEVLKQPFGPWLLGVVAAGLIAFGFYSAMSGLWLRFRR